ncbi:hypothetical protein ABTP36_19305, partial [Acinetobacter baumannii]
PEKQAALRERLKLMMRKNTYSPASAELTLEPVQVRAIESVGQHYSALFTGDPSLNKLRDASALQPKAIKNPESMRQLLAFFFWSSWTCST